MTVVVTGGSGFIGANFALRWLGTRAEPVIVLDAFTYAANPDNLASLAGDDRCRIVRGSIADETLVGQLLAEHDVRAVVHLAAETHVDRSISGPERFFETNVMGTLHLLQAARQHAAARPGGFRFLHVSTDEVYGALGERDPAFNEQSQYRPNSPYAASKAASDHLVRSFAQTYGLDAIITHCSNNYGPRQFPEKLIPLTIQRALGGQTIPIYGDGRQIRDWLHVDDHCDALMRVLDAGVAGETYDIGGGSELANIELVRRICILLDQRRPRLDGEPYGRQVEHVTDRPGHDRRYAIDSGKIREQLGWQARVDLDTGLERTVDWYLGNDAWVAGVTSGAYRDWIARQYG